jgi:hypothetical protein
MNVLKYTPKVALKQRALGRIIEKAANILAQTLKDEGDEVPADTIQNDLWEYCVFSTRLEFEAGEIDFSLAKAADTAETLALKYVSYLASDQEKAIRAGWAAIYQKDADIPTDIATSPVPPEGDDPSK